MNRKSLFKILFFLLLSGKAFSSFEFNERIQQSYLNIIRLQLEEGKRLLDEEQRLNPANSLPVLYYSYIDFLKAFISEEKKDAIIFNDNSDQRLSKLNSDDSPFCQYARGEILLQQAMLRIKFREFISAAWEIRKAYKIIGKNVVRYPSFPLNKKSIGFLHALVGAVPKDYRWLIKLGGMDGTILRGTDELYNLLHQIEGTPYYVYKEEILFYIASLHNSFSVDELNSSSLVAAMKPFSSQNPLMRYSLSNIQMKEGHNDEALHTLTDSISFSGTFPFFFLRYKTGLAKLRKMDFTASKDFQDYLSSFKGINYIRSAYQKIAWIHLLNGDQKKYTEVIALCKTSGSDFVDEDKDATNEANLSEIPNVILLRTRLLFDGGYYRRALEEIAGKSTDSFPRFKDQLEVTYRFARILLKMNLSERAVAYFNQTIQNGASSKYYFAANAALLLGNMFEERNEYEKAKAYYNQCLAMRNHEYQNSIDQKAQAGLERLKTKN